jgi:hypothetical protein
VIRVDKIQVCEFRGIRKLSLDLKGQNFAVCGPNGTGKSGIVDALEFALTGNISRLSGAGTGGLSVKDHGPHVDSRNKPDAAYVVLTLTIPSIGKQVVVKRSVKDAKSPAITPDTPEVRAVLDEVAAHPEFVLSRRELIKYVLSEPGKRSKEVQALLRLDEIEALRAVLQKVSNGAAKEADTLRKARQTVIDNLLAALGITEMNAEKVLEAANTRRAILSLPPLLVLDTSTSLKDGVISGGVVAPISKVSKAQAQIDLKIAHDALKALSAHPFAEARVAAQVATEGLVKDAELLAHVSREDLLRSALEHFDGEHCPVCDTSWSDDEFRAHIAAKLEGYQAATKKRAEVETLCAKVVDVFETLRSALQPLLAHGPLLSPAITVEALKQLRENLGKRVGEIEDFLPLDKTLKALAPVDVAPDFDASLQALEAAVAALPEPSAEEAAKDFLIVAQEKLGTYRSASQAAKAAQERAEKAAKVLEVYGQRTTAALENIFKLVETQFSDLYREINKEDESSFTAQLKPSIGKLGFDVDFYGRGHFPPGAYHSEGHQDGMGLCLYLALMSHLMGKGFTFAVLDDVLMSVDAGHRREVCGLLKTKVPNTQFVLTTHDDIWLKHMRTVGLIKAGAAAHFRKWTVDQGPTEWDDGDVWKEIQTALDKNDVPAAAAALRHYLEYFAGEVCHRLRARVEFRGDHQFMLGDLLPNAVAALGDLFKKAKAAAQTWKKPEEVQKITDRESGFATIRQATFVDQWQVNSAVHYNEWANFQKQDFAPVVEAFRRLVAEMRCAECDGLLYVSPERGRKEALRCACAEVNISLVEKQLS